VLTDKSFVWYAYTNKSAMPAIAHQIWTTVSKSALGAVAMLGALTAGQAQASTFTLAN
jgi:hypothetical protein